jgi:2,2-dialkylglycine decarboxylase (pyruvate)
MADQPSAGESNRLLDLARRVLTRTFSSDFELPLIERASGAVITDVDGRDHLDFSSGQMCATVGHNHPRIVEAIRQASAQVLHLNSSMLAPSVIRLAQRVTDLLPPPLKKVFFLSTGGESTEAALKMAKKATGKFEVVALADSFHGSSAGALSSTFIPKRRAGHGPLLPGAHAIFAPNCYRCPLGLTFPACDYACARTGFELVDRQSVGSLAALIAEPVQGAAGIVEPPPGYLAVLRGLCREREMLFILDEAQTGLGRLGDLWGFERDGAVPDILALSKTLGGGIPLAATVTSPALEERAYRAGFWFYTSHLNEPLPAAVGLAVLDVIREERLVDAAAEKGAYLKKGLLALKERYEIIGDVRGRGLLIGVDFVSDRATKKPAEVEAEAMTRQCLERGLFMVPIRQRGEYFVWRVAPPLTISYAEIDRALAIMEESLRAVCGQG